MSVDFSKMTEEQYELVLFVREKINGCKKELALLNLEINCLEDEDIEERKELQEFVTNMIELINEYDEKLKEFEI
jgi:anaerobic ribonucleoside-triphosphate reductase